MLTSEKAEKATSKNFMERVIFEQNVEYEPSQEAILSGLSSNISVGGLYLRTKVPFEIDDTLMLSFPLPYQEQEVSISCNARVAWTNYDLNRHKPDYASGVGLQFLDISHEDRSTLSNFLETYDEKKKMNVACAWCGNNLGMRTGPFGTTSHGLCNQCRESLDG
jgi:uncharacterized protein (TIGR02266 family)